MWGRSIGDGGGEKLLVRSNSEAKVDLLFSFRLSGCDPVLDLDIGLVCVFVSDLDLDLEELDPDLEPDLLLCLDDLELDLDLDLDFDLDLDLDLELFDLDLDLEDDLDFVLDDLDSEPDADEEPDLEVLPVDFLGRSVSVCSVCLPLSLGVASLSLGVASLSLGVAVPSSDLTVLALATDGGYNQMSLLCFSAYCCICAIYSTAFVNLSLPIFTKYLLIVEARCPLNISTE